MAIAPPLPNSVELIFWSKKLRNKKKKEKKRKVNLALVNEICNFLPKIYLSKFNQEQWDYQLSGMKTSIADKIKLLYIEYKYIDNDFVIEIHWKLGSKWLPVVMNECKRYEQNGVR